jgi:hypothetical protein
VITSRWLVGGLTALLLGGACSHTRAVTSPEHAAQAEKEDGAQKEPERPAHKKSRLPPEEKGALPLTSSPAGLLQPGAAETIQGRLVKGGQLNDDQKSGRLDAPTREALITFQKAHDLPATGIPDDATVRKLGLDPNAIFRKAAAP